MSKAFETAVTEADDIQVRYHAREAIRRLQDCFKEAYARDDLDAARSLVEKVHLVCGNRRMQHVKVGRNRRSQ